ncbi:MAG: FkbM family methyltransferase [Pseudomonadota bacterium]
MTEPFGALAPSPLQERFRALGRLLPANYFGRRAASLLLGPAGGRTPRAFDVDIFGTQKARLHPADNICEKRVFLTPQLWDGDERALLRAAISKFGGEVFTFVDVGANVGLYTLFARAEAARSGAKLKAVCIEADGEMAARLKFNIEASGASKDVTIFSCAASDAEGEVRFSIDRKSRGLSRVDPAGETRVAARPLAAIMSDAGLQKIDAMKIDIEGHEYEALSAFFRDAPRALHPSLIIMETSHASVKKSPEALLRENGYSLQLATRRNAVLTKGDQTPG